MPQIAFVSTTIPYVNSAPHIGFAIELVQADVFARYRRWRGDKIRFQSGTDENSLKNVLAARARGIPVQTHVDELAAVFRKLSGQLGISLTDFVRTSDPIHHDAVQSFWRRLNADDLFKKNYGGHYCVGCEDFWRAEDLREGRCPDHGTQPSWIEEENTYFRLSIYQKRLRNLIASDTIRITPSFRKQEILNFIEGGLQDISISRSRERSAGWGVRVPEDDNQIVYVWIDALVNYLTQDLTGGTEQIWTRETAKLHFIGKNVWKFHAIYWPALLLSAGLPLPNEIFIHGFLTLDGNKISKSLGPTIDPFDLLKSYGCDSLRFYLLRAFSPFDDGDFLIKALENFHNSYLVNGYGNLVSRLTTLARQSLGLDALSSGECLTEGHDEIPALARLNADVDEAFDQRRFDAAIKRVWLELDRLNAEIASARPWEKRGSIETQNLIRRWLLELAHVNRWISVFLPETGEKVASQLRDLGSPHPHLFERIKTARSPNS